MYALIRPDQVDVWSQLLLHELWNNQINCSIQCWGCRLSEETSGFCIFWKKGTEITVEEEENQMKKLYFDIHRAILLPSGETNADKPYEKAVKMAE